MENRFTGLAYISNSEQFVCIGELAERGTVFLLNVNTGEKFNISEGCFYRNYKVIPHNSITRLALELNATIT